MITATECRQKFGDPNRSFEGRWMRFYTPPEGFKSLPKKIYCHEIMAIHLDWALKEILVTGLQHLIKSWDGCFNVRKVRFGAEWSIHSWGLAIDINATENRLGQEPAMDLRLVEIFKKHGFDWGGEWRRKDGMHFQISKI